MFDFIWLPGVLLKYMVNSVLHFSKLDFIKALKYDLGPILGEVGLFMIN